MADVSNMDLVTVQTPLEQLGKHHKHPGFDSLAGVTVNATPSWPSPSASLRQQSATIPRLDGHSKPVVLLHFCEPHITKTPRITPNFTQRFTHARLVVEGSDGQSHAVL